ncbi:alpha/beta hydrolase family protein [Corynebacterium sp.]|uniref:alpha/beta hydrolase n=1 Tax=Corynebacterium sp. TaxID=1720 RepID=UPI0026475254|nr:alpha/beta hydrolase family protein [Corynebacterium sp.]MDN5720163.1 esterase family protein [Corynebacterium sp.]MDN6326104.1 esterase family protein [Corynebacterium sp.]
MNKRAIARVTAAAVATALPLSVMSVLGAGPAFAGIAQPDVASASDSSGDGRPASEFRNTATVNNPFPTREAAEGENYVEESKAAWRDYVYHAEAGVSETDPDDTWEAGERYGRMEERMVHSKAMNRDIPVVTIRAKEDPQNAPTIYLLNGADGGEGAANWLRQTNAVDFYGNQIGNVNVVIPMEGAFSYYTDWQEPNATLDKGGNKQAWETFLVQELPGPMETALGTYNPNRSIIGMSMTGSTTLVYGEKYSGFYDSIGAYSGCAATSGEAAPTVEIVLGRGNATYEQMWGDRNGQVARDNDALVNAADLKDQHNVYVSTSTGLMGEHDVSSGDRLNGMVIGSIVPATEGGVIEAATNACTHLLKSTTDAAGITQESNNLVYNFRNTGTHQWGYWQDDMFDAWPTISEGLFPGGGANAVAQRDAAKAAYLEDNPGAGAAGSTPVSSLPTWDEVTANAEEADDE